MLSNVALASVCGDDVGGERVPCACGDTIVSDTKLRSTDPVVHGRCPLDGLRMRADKLAETITLNLGGLSIVGTGAGIGIEVEHGGADGALIVGSDDGRQAEVVGFGTGVRVRGMGSLRRLENLSVKGSRHDGLSLRAAGAIISNVSAIKNGGDGIRLRGSGGRLMDVEARANRRTGIYVGSRGAVLEGRATDNGRHGVICEGGGNDLRKVVANGNGGLGVVVGGAGHKTEGLIAQGNALGSIVTRRTRRGTHGSEGHSLGSSP